MIRGRRPEVMSGRGWRGSRSTYLSSRTGGTMAEQRFSNTVGLACNLATHEAMADGSPAIEPVHLLIGICSLEKVFSPAIKRIAFSRDDLDGIGVEWSFAMSVFTDAKINPVLLRRTLRKPAKSRNIEPRGSIEFSKESQSALAR